MSANFLNLFNQINNLVNTGARLNAGMNKAAAFNNFNNGPSSVFTPTNTAFVGQTQNVLPTVDLSPAKQAEQNLINQQLQESILQTQEALKEFTQEDKSALIKEMLNLPEDMSALLKNLINKNKNLTNAEFMKLLSMINVNGKEAATKLSKLMVFLGSNNIKGAEKLQEVYSIINTLASGSAQNASQLMKNVILLYLPWLPIGEGNNFEIGMKKTESNKGADGNEDDDEKKDSDSDSISVFIQTVNYSNVKVTLYLEVRQNISLHVECVANFPKEQLQEMIKGDAQKLNVRADVNFSQTTNKNTEKNTDTDFSVNVSKYINPYLMLMAQAVIKAVIEIDKHTTLIEKRRAG